MVEFFEEEDAGGEGIDFAPYFRALLRRWWIVVLVFFGVTVPWILYVRQEPPIYQAETWIGFESVAGEVPGNLVQWRIRKLRSRSFAEEVTAELGLTLHFSKENDDLGLTRQDVFKVFSTTRNPIPGGYELRFYSTGFCAFYFKSMRLDSLRVEKFIDDTVSYNGLSFSLNPDVVRSRSRVDFVIGDFQAAVRSLIARERIDTNREGNLMKLTLKDGDPILASQTVNMLASIFVQKSYEMRRETNRFMRNYLEEQLAIVQQELNNSDFQLKTFRDKHLVGLDQETEQTVNQLNGMERGINRSILQKNELDLLLEKLDPNVSDFDAGVSTRYIYRQIAVQPAFQNDADMTIARQELADLEQSRGALLEQGYPHRNPTVVEISENISMVEDKIYRLAMEKLKEIESQIAEMREGMEGLQKKLDTLPEEELRFIRLSRQRSANEEIHEMLLRRYKEAQISEAVVSENVSILDPAIPPNRPISGNKKKKTLIGVFIGLCLGVGLVLLLEVSDKSIKTREDVKRYLKLPILGIIPNVKFDSYELLDSEKAKSISSQIVTHDYSPTPVGEAYRSLRTNLLFSKSVGPIRSLVVGSIAPGEGKSFTAANLAIALAQQKSKTLLIDADLRRGVLHNTFNCSKKPGLTNYLTGVVSLENVLNETYIPNLSLITCGSLIPNPSELLGSMRMQRFIEGITKRFNFVIFDTPPLLAATDAVILGTLVDGLALLIRSGKTSREEVQRKLELFQNVRARILGVILNGAGVEVAHEGYSYYAY